MASPLEIGIGLKCMFIAQFVKASSKKKIRLTNSLGAGKSEKNAHKKVKKFENILFVLNKY